MDFTSFSAPYTPILREKILKWANLFPCFQFLDSCHLADKYGEFDFLVGIDSIRDISSKCSFQETLDSTKGKYWFGYLGYPSSDNAAQSELISFPDLHFFEARYVLYGKDNRIFFNQNYPESFEIWEMIQKMPIIVSPKKSQKIKFMPITSSKTYLETVSNILEDIAEGKYYELNYCQAWEGKITDFCPIESYVSLSQKAQQSMSGIYKYQNKYILCFSPERLLRYDGQKATTQPIKGTSRRNLDDNDFDQKLARNLENSTKERAENIMIADMSRHDLTKYAELGTVTVEELCKIYSYPLVHQMVSTISAKVRNENAISALLGVFPAASMTGAPKKSAMMHIAKYENFKRGPYSGSLGYIAPDGSFDFNVIIRSIYADVAKKKAFLATGGAITIQSSPLEEYEECILKASFLLDFFQSK